ncbi:hypothetical protein [Streptomyces sp. NPDC001652]|uniref:hypothetical protein n=1 Tax=Streptomyces sp. NPDC001652 TaxID=3154393 RepID=UPI0033199F25
MAATTDARSAVTPNRVHPGMSRRLALLLAVATGAIAANLYYAQPLLEVIARSLGTSAGAAGAIVTVTQLGFAAGLVFVLPPADIVKRRSLLTALLLLDAAALAMVGLAPGLGVALAAYAVLGLANVVAQLLVPAAARLADAAAPAPQQQPRPPSCLTPPWAALLCRRSPPGHAADAAPEHRANASGFAKCSATSPRRSPRAPRPPRACSPRSARSG